MRWVIVPILVAQVRRGMPKTTRAPAPPRPTPYARPAAACTPSPALGPPKPTHVVSPYAPTPVPMSLPGALPVPAAATATAPGTVFATRMASSASMLQSAPRALPTPRERLGLLAAGIPDKEIAGEDVGGVLGDVTEALTRCFQRASPGLQESFGPLHDALVGALRGADQLEDHRSTLTAAKGPQATEARDTCYGVAEDALARFAKTGRALIDAGSPGHAVLLEIVKTESGTTSMSIYNSGAGSEAHVPLSAQRAALHRTKRSSADPEVAKQALRFRIDDVTLGSGMRELNAASLGKILEHSLPLKPSFFKGEAARLRADDRALAALYEELNLLGRVHTDHSDGAAQSLQKGQDCTVECVFALLRNNLSNLHYQELKLLFLNDVVATSKLGATPVAPALATLFADANKRLDRKTVRTADRLSLAMQLQLETKLLRMMNGFPEHIGHADPDDVTAQLQSAGGQRFALYDTRDRNEVTVLAFCAAGSTVHMPIGRNPRTGHLEVVLPNRTTMCGFGNVTELVAWARAQGSQALRGSNGQRPTHALSGELHAHVATFLSAAQDSVPASGTPEGP